MFVHTRNYGYGANQKTCYAEALKAGADIVVMVHPDYQYDPTLLPEIIQPIVDGEADSGLGLAPAVPGRRSSRACRGGSTIRTASSPGWRMYCFGLNHTEYHTGYRAFHRSVLEAVNFSMNSDGFVFDQEIIAQAVACGARIGEIAVPVRYFREASSASFFQSRVYGLRILWLLAKYVLHKTGLRKSRQFQSLHRRYVPADDPVKVHGTV